MGPLKNKLHENFLNAIASGKFSSDGAAYKSLRPLVSDHVAAVKACIILQMPRSKERLAELAGVWKEKARLADAALARTIELAAERMAEKEVATREWVIDKLVEVANRAMQAVQVLDADGAPTGEWKHDANAAIRALELLGKEAGMFVDRSINLNVNYGISEQPMTPEEWAAKHCDQAKAIN